MNKKILVFGVILILSFSAFFVLANDIKESVIDGGYISGYVRQVNGNAISNATIELIRQDNTGWRETNSELDGSYIFTDLPNGNYIIRAFKKGYAREYYNNALYALDAIILDLGDSDIFMNINFSLTLGGSISGKVYDNDTGVSISGVTVKVESIGHELDGFWSETDENGVYQVDCLFLGSYHIGVNKEGYVDKWYNDYWDTSHADDIKVTPPDDISDINFDLERGGSIFGYVFDIEGNPVLGVQVGAGGFGPRGYCGDNTLTDTTGYYYIEDIPEWMYKVRVNKPGYAIEYYDSKISEDSADFINVFNNQNISNINFTLDMAGKITGKVYDADDNSPIQGIEFFVFLPNNEKVGVFCCTDYQGAYTIWLRTGTYYLSTGSSAIGNSYINEWYDNSYDFEHATSVYVISPDETSGIDFYLSKAGSISGHVQDINGNPISDASIYAFSNDFPGNGAISGEDGNYIIEGLQSGDYLVQVTVSGFNTQYYDNVSDSADAILVTVNAPNETKFVDFVLTQGIGVYISRPETGVLYLFDKEILSLPIDFPVIIGKINVKAIAFGADKVEFYVDDELKYTDDESPFSWLWDKAVFGRHTVKVVVYEVVDIVSDEMIVWKFF